jgi:hypothetical protein
VPQVPIFEPVAHRYFVDGEECYGVTNVLKYLGLYPPYSDDPMYRDRGTAGHTATEFSDLGLLDKSLTHPTILAYVECWERFCADFGLSFKPEHIEVRVADPTTHTAGTIDRIREWQNIWWIWDIKLGNPPPAAALQTAGYAELSGHSNARRASVWLRPGCNPLYRIREYSDPNDLTVWRACRQIYACPAATRIWTSFAKDVRYDDITNCLLLWNWRTGKE